MAEPEGELVINSHSYRTDIGAWSWEVITKLFNISQDFIYAVFRRTDVWLHFTHSICMHSTTQKTIYADKLFIIIFSVVNQLFLVHNSNIFLKP